MMAGEGCHGREKCEDNPQLVRAARPVLTFGCAYSMARLVRFIIIIVLHEIHLVPQNSTHPAKALDELRALLRPVCDEFKRRSEVFVVGCEPLDQLHLLNHLKLGAVLAQEISRVFLALHCQVLDDLVARAGVFQCVSHISQVLPHYQSLHRTHLQPLERVLNPKAELARVLRDLLKVLRNELLLLHESHIAERLLRELDGLIEAVLAAIGDINRLQHFGGKSGVELVRLREHHLKVSGTRKN
mmetsp:Transcript_18780/g.56717  ORF Transcript_18780/g.56717 Transcript_18780/m.56717 type:complete len:243 (-) Transcript_18780:697-1425(-)